MAASDYTWVSTPHTPYTISGSDPYIKSTDYWPTVDASHQARLVAWYNFDEGNYISGSAKDSETGRICHSVKDLSQNSEGLEYTPVSIGATARHLQRDDEYPGIVSGNIGGANDKNLWIPADIDRSGFLMNSYQWSYGNHGSIHMGLAAPNTDGDNYDVEHSWISCSADASHNAGTMGGGYSLHAIMRNNSSYTSTDRPFGVTYPHSEHDGYKWNGHDSSFYLSINDDHDGSRNAMFGWEHDDERLKTTSDMDDNWYVLNGVYDRQTARDTWHCKLYLNGKLEAEESNSPGSGNYPRQMHNNRRIAIGGRYDFGGGFQNNKDMTAHPTSSYISGLGEFFIFDDRLSDQRRLQMDAYCCDRWGLGISSSLNLSTFAGEHRGAKGSLKTHSDLSNALSGKGTYCRRYKQWATGSAQASSPMQHETVAGAFAKSTLDSSAYYRPKSTEALSLRCWVRAERLDDPNHSGSHVAMIAKGTSPWGNKLDHLKGYSLKFGTFLNGLDTGDNAPKFILGLRNANGNAYDGGITDECEDTVVTNSSGGTPASITTPVIDTWYNIRLDVIPFGLAYDQIKAYASLDGSTWYQLGSTVTLDRSSVKYRHWSDDDSKSPHLPHSQGTHNGYYVAMSSSNGKSLQTTYYVDNFEIHTDTVA
jgi:hypothetical protein